MPTLEDAPTMRDEPQHATGGGAKVQVDASPIDGGVSSVRYQMGDLLGEGGMGEVRRCRDLRIGRDVAMKTVREVAADRDFVHERFLREARVQGQLEHPCIVPVYDLGAREDGTTYFTMKRIRGETLEQILDALRAGDPAASARWTRRKLLAAFVTACGAVEYAHSRGVIHRDLKPGNIMLGDFGEVYVLDWGVARVLDGSADPVTERIDAPMPELGRTVEGAVIGTAGYMPVEQLSGVSDLDARADVYALGAILFELLAWEPLHVGTTLPGLVTSTLMGADARPSVRAPTRDVPPELDAICVKATAREREGRYTSARELLDAVERFLDGHRDLERRKALAAELSASASASATRALAGNDAERATALRDVGRALALDPENPGALRTFVRLLVEPPREVPAEVETKMVDDYNARRLGSFRGGAIAFAIWLALTPLALWIGVRDWVSFLSMAGLVAACGGLCAYVARTGRHIDAIQRAVMLFAVTAAGFTTRLFGPFVLVPALIVVVTFVFALTPDPRWRRLFMALGSLGMVGPILLEVSGVVAPSYVFHDGLIELHPRMTWLTAGPSLVSLMLVHLGLLLAMVQVVGRMRDAFDVVSRRLHLQAWQLRQIVPSDSAGT